MSPSGRADAEEDSIPRTVEYYSAVTKKGIPPLLVMTWTDLEDIILSDKSDGKRQLPHGTSKTWKLKKAE